MIVTVLGARPQFVKAAVVSRALASAGLAERIVHTGQHYDDRMSAVFWRELGLPGIASNLEVGSGNHGAQTAQMMERLEALILQQSGIKGLLVYGDTNSTLAGALVAAKLNLPVFHVEAGLRSFDRTMPEEVNRVVADHLSTLLFCPSDHAREQLAKEGITRGVHIVGDVMLDAIRAFRNAARTAVAEVTWGDSSRRKAILTVHRPANTDAPGRLQLLLDTLRELPLWVLWPLHPRVQSRVSELNIPNNVSVRPPLSYFEMLQALERTDLVLTDSGGLQKESYWSRRRCITLRNETEWVETLHGGWNTLVGSNSEALQRAVLSEASSDWKPLYGNGDAGDKIAQCIREHGA